VISKSFPSDITKIKSNIGGNLIVYELPATPMITPMSAAEERTGNHTYRQQSPHHYHHHGDQYQQQQQQQQLWSLGQIQRGLTSEYIIYD